MDEMFSREALLISEESVQRLHGCRVVLFGLGGVGGMTAEALARCGVGSFRLVDHDIVSISNLNRQIIATRETIGKKKVDVMKERILSINPDALVETFDCFYLPGNEDDLFSECDLILDAIDTVSAKIALAEEANYKKIPIISCMGTGNKLDPTRFEAADLQKTSVCPLCRVMRRELKKRGIEHLRVIYSREEPIKGLGKTPGSIMPVTASAGLLLASEGIRILLQK